MLLWSFALAASKTFRLIQISTLPARCLVNISFATVFCLLRVHAQRPLPSHSVMEGLILILRPYDVSRCGPILDPCHHGEQNVMLSVREAGNAVNVVSEQTRLVRTGKIPRSVHVRRRAGAVSGHMLVFIPVLICGVVRTYCMPGTRKKR